MGERAVDQACSHSAAADRGARRVRRRITTAVPERRSTRRRVSGTRRQSPLTPGRLLAVSDAGPNRGTAWVRTGRPATGGLAAGGRDRPRKVEDIEGRCARGGLPVYGTVIWGRNNDYGPIRRDPRQAARPRARYQHLVACAGDLA